MIAGALAFGRARFGTLAVCAVLGAGLYGLGGGIGYHNGYHQGRADYIAAANAATVESLSDRFDVFEADLSANRAQGDATRDAIEANTDAIERTAHEISGFADRLDCPADPRVGVSIDAAHDTTAAAIDRAAGRGADGDTQGKRSAGPSPG